jgi:hypothetical protein
VTPAWIGPAEGPAPLEPAGGCDPTPKPGPIAFRSFVLARFGGSDLGIVRACHIGKPSHHHEGRAWDWAALASKAEDRARVEALMVLLFSNGDEGMRRAGIRSLIWDGRVYTVGQGSAPHAGNPHTDHVHFSFSREGASGATSFYRWLEAGAPELVTPAPAPLVTAAEGGGALLGALALAALVAAAARRR